MFQRPRAADTELPEHPLVLSEQTVAFIVDHELIAAWVASFGL
jgi:hypothetical protein